MAMFVFIPSARTHLFALILLGAAAGVRGGEIHPGAASLDVTSSAYRAELSRRATDMNRTALDFDKNHDFKSAASVLEQARGLWVPCPDLLPGMHSSVLANLADAYEHQSMWHEAVRVLEETVALEQRIYGPSATKTELMQVRLGEAEVMLGELDRAEARLTTAVEVLRLTTGSERVQLAFALASLAVLDANLLRTTEAEALASEATGIMQATGTENADYGTVLGVLAGIFVIEGQNARALPLLTRSIDILQRTTPDNVRIAPLLVQRGVIEAGDRKYVTAETDMQHAIVILDGGAIPKVNGDWARLHLGRIYMAQKKIDDAAAIIPSTVERQRAFFGSPCRRLALCIRELARLRALQKRYAEARALYCEAIGMVRSEPVMLPDTQGSANEKQIRALEERTRELLEPGRNGG